MERGKVTQQGIAARRLLRREREKGQSDARYAEIVRAAAQVFRDRGYADSTLEDVAEVVGINRASLYYYVGTKEELLTDVLEAPLVEMTRSMRLIATSKMSATERLRGVISFHLDSFDQLYPNIFVFLAEWLHIGQRIPRLRQNATEYGEIFMGIIEDGQRLGEFRADVDRRIAMLGILGMLNWTHRWYRKDGELTLGEIGEQFATLIIDGLKADARSSTRASRRRG
jgi:AcrR family transcriptional regulator